VEVLIMIKNKLVALAILAILISGTIVFAVYRSPWGPVLTLAGIVAYFIFNKKG
jgi:hypothetical protein